jgi:tetratricopeptide (TPR) repeat protein
MEMFLGHTVPADDARLPAVYGNFRRNLEEICRVGQRAGAAVILSTVAVNLKDCPPFHGSNAELRFRRAQSLLAEGKTREASREFQAARDLDELRFRADTHTNRIIRETASAMGRPLVDAEQAFGRAGIPGDELFYEHVHLNFGGNDLLARTLLPQVVASLRLPPASVPDSETVWRDLARTAWDEYRMRADITAIMQRPPFRRQASQPLQPGAEVLHEANARFTEVLQARPADLHVRQRLADVLGSLGELPAAEAEWRALLERLPGVQTWQIALASVLANEKKLDQALAEYRRVLENDAQFAAAQFGAGSVLQRQRQWDAAARYYAAALRLNPAYAEVENNLGLMRVESAGDWDGAMEHYRRAAALKPELSSAHLNLAGALARRGRTEEAKAAYERVLRAYPDSVEAHYELGGLLARAGNIRGAREHLEAAVRLRPAWVEARYDLGSVLSREGALPEAVEQFTQALRLRSDYPEAWNNLGSALARRGELSRAVECFKKAIALRPDFAAARANLATALNGQR